MDWEEEGEERAGLCLFSRSVLTYCFSLPQRVAAGWTGAGESGLFAEQPSKCTLWALHKFPALSQRYIAYVPASLPSEFTSFVFKLSGIFSLPLPKAVRN